MRVQPAVSLSTIACVSAGVELAPVTAITPAARDLVYRLPELLEGPEPVLERPQVKEYLQTNPEMQGALLAVGEMARALALGSDRPPSLPRSTARILSRPVQTARTYFAQELATVLFDQGVAHYSRATRELGIAAHPHLFDVSPLPASQLPAETPQPAHPT